MFLMKLKDCRNKINDGKAMMINKIDCEILRLQILLISYFAAVCVLIKLTMCDTDAKYHDKGALCVHLFCHKEVRV